MGEIKSCPRCQGNVFLEWDYSSDGRWYEYCLQCSYRHYLPIMEKSQPEIIPTRKRKRRRSKRRREQIENCEG